MNTNFLGSRTSLYPVLPSHNYAHNRQFLSMRPLVSIRLSHHKFTETANTRKTRYKDKYLDLIAINHLSHNLQAVAGVDAKKEGYEGLLEVCKKVKLKFDLVKQRQLTLEALRRAFPTRVFTVVKLLLPHSMFAREFLAKFTVLFLFWLVGPSQVKESKFKGHREKNVVHIQKCRFLESSDCIGMCTNLCKFPTQTFIKDSLGVPVTMNPNFEDMSCEMIFGEEPPKPEEDPVTKQLCYKQCKIKKRRY